MADYTTTGLIASIRRRGFIPQGSGTSDANLLEYATDELRSYITSFLKSIREELIVSALDVAVTSGVVPAPVRAVGAALRTIQWLDPSNNRINLPRIEPENVPAYAGLSGNPVGFYFQGNDIILLPAPTSGTLRLTYQQRPGQLVSTTACALVANVSTNTLTVAAMPTAFLDSELYDIVSGQPNFVLEGMDLSVDTVDPVGLTITFTNALPTGIHPGDYVCIAGETCIAQVPLEVHDLLAQQTAMKIAQATGSSRLAAIKAGTDELEKQMRLVLSPRADGSARYVINRSGAGIRRWVW